MARKHTPNTEKTSAKSLDSIFEAVDALNPSSTLLSDENSLSVVNDWIDTGCYALNAICSGSLYKGIPVGRITGFSGVSSAGKSLMINKTIANAQKNGYFAAIWDTEIATDKQSILNVGGDPTRVKYYPVETIEDCRNQIATFLDKIVAAKDPSIKVIIAIDSLGNLVSAKEAADVVEGKTATDMGTRAKALKSMIRNLTYKAAKARVPILFSNHTYENPTAMYPELVKRQSGGSGPIYLASLLLQLAVRNEKIDKNEDEESIAIAHNVSGVTLTAMTVKNRFVPPFLKTELYNNFRTGLDKYAGLRDIAIAFKVVAPEKEGGTSYMFNGKKIGRASVWENDHAFWESALPEIEKALQREICYNQVVEDVVNGDVDDEEDEAKAV